MADSDYQLIRFARAGRVLTATVEAPPINIVTLDLFAELARLAEELAADRETGVFVLKSADPDFFLAHFDVAAILGFPVDAPPPADPGANAWHAMCRRFATMDIVTIAQIEGRIGGGGAELAMNFDMRFGVSGKTIINQMEVPLGILPGGTGTQLLPRLVGRARALEIILSGNDLDAETAVQWGWLNRALPADGIESFVTGLAQRIAGFPADAVRLAKAAINGADLPLADGLAAESLLFQTAIRTPEARAAMARFLRIGGQTREGELRIADLSAQLAAD